MMQSVEALPEAAELETSLGTVGNDVEEVPASFQHSSDNESFKGITKSYCIGPFFTKSLCIKITRSLLRLFP